MERHDIFMLVLVSCRLLSRKQVVMTAGAEKRRFFLFPPRGDSVRYIVSYYLTIQR